MNPQLLRYKCANCGNSGLEVTRPSQCACDKPDWKLMKHQQALRAGCKDWIHPDGEI